MLSTSKRINKCIIQSRYGFDMSEAPFCSRTPIWTSDLATSHLPQIAGQLLCALRLATYVWINPNTQFGNSNCADYIPGA